MVANLARSRFLPRCTATLGGGEPLSAVFPRDHGYGGVMGRLAKIGAKGGGRRYASVVWMGLGDEPPQWW
jgi:hypothetical protein